MILSSGENATPFDLKLHSDHQSLLGTSQHPIYSERTTCMYPSVSCINLVVVIKRKLIMSSRCCLRRIGLLFGTVHPFASREHILRSRNFTSALPPLM